MKRSEHIEFAEFVAMQTYYEEMKRLGIPRDALKDLIAKKAAKWIGRNIGTLPDWLEPGYSQYHRKIFHSKDIGKAIEKVKQELRSKAPKNWELNVFLLMALTAYQSHLALDSTTPIGIPDYGWVWKLLESFKSKKRGNLLY